MNTMDAVGWIAAALVVGAFYLKTMVSLRCVAIASNLAFIGYGLMAGTPPIVVLHMLLLPLNMLRLQQMRQRVRRVKRASRGTPALDMLAPYMEVRRLSGGTRLFEAGEHADEVFLILSGRVRIVDKDIFVKIGQLVGVVEIFAPEQRRIDTVVCDGEVELASIAAGNIRELFCQNPEFGAYLLRLIIQHAEGEVVLGPSARPATQTAVSMRTSMATASS